MQRRRVYTSILMLCVLAVAGFSQTVPDHDLQFWNENTIVIPAISRIKDGTKVDFVNLLALQNNRLGGEGIRPIDERLGFGFDVIINKYLTLTPSYLYRGSRTVPLVWDYEHRVRFDATVGYSWKHLGIKNRNRFERRIRNSHSDITRYRNRTTVKVPVRRDDKTLFDIFASMEPFADITARSWPSYEFMSGVSTHISDRIAADFFYVHRGEIQSLSQTVNGFGVNVKIRIGK